MKTLYIIFLMLVTIAAPAQKTWTGDISTNWSNPMNWTPNVIPGAGDNVIFPNFAPNCFVDVAPNNIAGITMAAGYTNNLDLNGFTLTIGGGFVKNFLGGTVSGVNGGVISITGENAVTFNGTDFPVNNMGVVSITILLTNTAASANGVFTGTSATTFGGPVSVTAPSILLNGSTYSSSAYFEKKGTHATTVPSLGEGGNTFAGSTTLVNSMNNIFRTANKAGTIDNFNGTLTLELNGSNTLNDIELAYSTGTHTNFNGDVLVKSKDLATMATSLAAATISIGGVTGLAGGGTSTLGFDDVITEVNPGVNVDNFQRGEFIIKNLTQQINGEPQSLDLRYLGGPSANALRLHIINCVFYGAITIQASNSFVSYSTFHADASFSKAEGGTGDPALPALPPAGGNTWPGGNTYHGDVVFNHLNASTWAMAGTQGDTFNGDIELNTKFSTSHFIFAHATGTTSVFKGNISVTKENNTPEMKLSFGRGGGTAMFAGSAAQSITFDRSYNVYEVKFGNLEIDNSNGLFIGLPATIFGNLNFKTGNLSVGLASVLDLNSDTLTFENSATVSGASDFGHVTSNVLKRGKAPFVFPIGDNNSYHPIGITAPSDPNDVFAARYFSTDHLLGANRDAPLEKISDCEYWTLDRMVGATDPTVTLYWNDASYCHTNYITDPSQLQVVRWSGALWNNLGASTYISGPSTNGTDGNVTAGMALPNSASHKLTFGSLSVLNVLPITLESFQVLPGEKGPEIIWQTATENNNDYFTVQKLYRSEFISLANVQGAGTANLPAHYSWTDTQPLPGLSYYRLKQTDFDGHETYSDVVAFHWKTENTPYPNPVTTTLFLNGINFDEDSELIVKDIAGRTVYVGKATFTIDFSNFISGMYHLGVKNNTNVRWYSIKKE